MHDGSTPNTYLYTGQQYDEVTGLYSLRARYYNPSDGRFLSRDTYAYHYQNPIELNRYLYAANNPITNYDPSGQFALMAYDRTIKDISMENIPILSLLGKGVLFLWNIVWWSLRFLIAVSPVLAALGPLVAPNTAPPPPGSVWDPYNQNNWDLWRDTAPPDVVVDPPTIPCSGGSRCDANPYDDTIPEYENPTEHSRETNEETSARQQREGPRYADPPQPPPEENDGECSSPTSIRRWRRTIFVPDTQEPVDVILSAGLGMPPFHAGQFAVSEFQVECIASAMQQGIYLDVGSIEPIKFDKWKGRPKEGINKGDWPTPDKIE